MQPEKRTAWLLAALAPPLVALALQTVLWGLIEPLVWFLFYPAVFISSAIGGRRSGVIATATSIALVWWVYIPAGQSLAAMVPHLFSTGAFFVMGLLFGTFHERLRDADRKSQAIVSGAMDCIVSFDAAGHVTGWNPAAEQTFGYSRAEALGRDLADLILPQPMRERYRGGMQTRDGRIVGRRVELPALTQDGRELAMELSVTRLPDGPATSFVAFARDISQRKQAERDRNRQLEAQALLDHVTVALASSLDLNDTVHKAARLVVRGFADRCAVDLLGERGSLQPAAIAHAQAETGSEETQLRAPIRFRHRTLGVLRLARARPFDASDRALADELARRIGLAVDNAQHFRDAQDAVRARDDFLQVASHELKTPLTPLQLQLERLARAYEKKGLSDESVRRKLDVAQRQTQRLARLVESLLDVSRISAGRLELELQRCELPALVRDVVRRYQPEASAAGSHLEVVSADASIAGEWDPLRLEQILGNLLSNAIKYGSGRPIEVDVRASDEIVRVSVADRGIGIEKALLQRIFGRFERGVSVRHYGGLGLGLYVARQLAEAHGGTILAASEPGRGSTFTLLLPRAPAGAEHAAEVTRQ